MDTNAILIIIGLLILLWLASRFFGNRAPTTPTYDDKNIRSGGSIGGGPGQPGQRTHDDPNIESGGSLGGRSGEATPRTHDDPNIRSGGSFGGSNATREREAPRSGNNPFNTGARSTNAPSAEELRERSTPTRRDTDSPPKRSGNDDPNTRSGGSFGG